jgi:hypothetical protein
MGTYSTESNTVRANGLLEELLQEKAAARLFTGVRGRGVPGSPHPGSRIV